MLALLLHAASSGIIQNPSSPFHGKFQIRAASLGLQKGISCLFNISRHVSLMFAGIGRYANDGLSRWIRQHSGDIFWSNLKDDARLSCYEILYSRADFPAVAGPGSFPPELIYGLGHGRVSRSRNMTALAGFVVRFKP